MASASGELLKDRYRIGSILGEGAMGAVARAYDEILRREVAVKILKPTLARDAQFVERFYAEARALAGLVDRRIVAIHDILIDGATHAIVMEYVDGPSLAGALAHEGRLPEARAAGYAREVALALAAAHARGVLHRDIKPANVLLSREGAVKVADFGLAKALASGGDQSLTMTGTVVGSASYFSPEQAQGLPLTPASDLYSLGVVLHQLVTGTLPFEAESPIAIAVAHVTTPPPTEAQLSRKMSPGLAAIVHRLLQKDPRARYASATELASALGALTEPAPQPKRVRDEPTSFGPAPAEPQRPVRAPSRRWFGRKRWFAAALLVAILGAGWAIRSRTVTIADVRHAPAKSAEATLTSDGVTPSIVTRPDMVVPAGTVIAEDPSPGTDVRRGSVVRLTVSSGPPLVSVPDVGEMDAATAERTLLGRKLHANVSSRPADAPPNTVISQNPPAGTTVRAGTTAVIVVSTGPTPPPNTDDSPPPGWLRKTWWKLFHHRHGHHDDGD